VATEALGPGPQGLQKRVTAAATGEEQGILAVWSAPTSPVGGPRTIAGAISPDAGSTWGSPVPIASFPGHDLVNPFVVLLRDGELRVYFTQDVHVPSMGYVRSTDHGRTWSDRVDVGGVPEGTSPARIVVVDDPAHGLVAFTTTVGCNELWVCPLPD
jgi:hypothetical protein